MLYKEFGGSPTCQNDEKSTGLTHFRGNLRFCGTLIKFHGTLVCRGTPVEKHWPNEGKLCRREKRK